MTEPSISPSELPAIGFLAEVSSEHRSFLACFGKFKRLAEGETLIREGEPQDSLYVILSGKLHIVADAAERPLLLAALEPGDSIGEINLFDPGTASASASARAASLVWSLSRSELALFLEADPAAGIPVLHGLLAQLAKRIRSMNEKLTTSERKSTLHDFWGSSHP
jgi:CRP-like cAMP-binding protein